MFAIALLLRIAIAPYFGFFIDLRFFRTWSAELGSVGMRAIYATDPNVDYPPAFLYVLWTIGKLSNSPGYLFLKLPSIIADLGLAWIAGTMAARVAPRSMQERMAVRSLAMAAVLFNPAVFALSAGWGQVDSIPTFLFLASILLVFTESASLRSDIGAAILFTIAFAMKPQACLGFPVIVYALYRRYLHNKPREELLRGSLTILLLVAIGVAVGVLSGLPFGLGPSGLFHAYQHAARVHTVTSANAFNFWGLLAFWRNDSVPNGIVSGGVMTFAGLHAVNFGLLSFAIATTAILWQLHRALNRGVEQSRALLVASAALSLLGFTFLTRMHERYLFAALVSFAPFVFMRPLRRTYVALSILFLLNLWYPYAAFNERVGAPALRAQPWFDWIYGDYITNSWQKKALSLVVVIIALVVAWRWVWWLIKLERRGAVAPPQRVGLNISGLFRSLRAGGQPEDALETTASAGIAAWAPLFLVGLTCVFGLVMLYCETHYAQNLNDTALHLPMVQWASGQIREGRLPLDGWFPIYAIGSSFFHHYQSFPHIVTALLANVTGMSDETVYLWILYLLLALWPICIYLSARLFDLSKWTAALAAAISPLLVSAPGYGYEHGSYTWQGYGVYSQEWGMWLLPLAWGFTWRAVNRGKHYAAAAVALALTIACHFITGYLALLTLGVWVIVVGRSGFLERFYRSAIASAGALLIAAWVIVPLVGDTKYSAQTEYYKGSIFSDSFGAKQILSWLFKGELFDYQRFPVVTILFFAGALICLARWRTDNRGRALFGAFTLSLILFFGRPTLGRLLDILPGFKDVQIHRFVMGVDLAAILIAGIGLGWLIRVLYPSLLRLTKNNQLVASAAAVWLCVVVLAPGWIERVRYDRRGDLLIRSQQGYDASDGRDMDRLIDVVQKRHDGRVYAGMRANWGHLYKVGSVTVHAWLADRQIDAIGFVFRTITSLSTDVEVAFEERSPAQYEMLNIRYVIVPADRIPSVPATLIMSSGRHRLYEVPTTGYFQVVDRSAPLAANRANIQQATRDFRFSNLPLQAVYPGVGFAGKAGPPPTFSGPAPPPGKPGEVLAQANTLQNGVFLATVSATRPATALLKATFDPRWSATVDGRPAQPVMMAPSLVGVDVPPGVHTVAFRYKPYAGYPLLIAIGAVTLLALILIPRRDAVRSRIAQWKNS
jgi:Gpi18-like mannosyltransferase